MEVRVCALVCLEGEKRRASKVSTETEVVEEERE